jgi:hypothetical protein
VPETGPQYSPPDQLMITELSGGRRSGRTYRMLQHALNEMRLGKKVAVVMQTTREISQVVGELTKSLGASPTEVHQIQFVSKDQAAMRLRGRQLDLVFADHCVFGTKSHEQSRGFASFWEYETTTALLGQSGSKH